MLPYIELFNRQFSMYALCIMIGLGLGIFVAVLRAKYYCYSKEDILFASFYGILGVIVGGKILYLITIMPILWKNLSTILNNLEIIKALMTGGFVFYGGLFGGLAGITIYAVQYKLNITGLIETIVPSVPLIHAFGRLGCFCAGCCYGKPFPAPFGMVFRASQIAPHDISLFPVQLVEAGCNLLLFIIILLYFRKKKTSGEITAFYMAGYGIIRFGLEFLRYDRDRGFLFGISVSQWISIGVVIAAIVICLKQDKAKNVRKKS